jgi:hypothetical protein
VLFGLRRDSSPEPKTGCPTGKSQLGRSDSAEFPVNHELRFVLSRKQALYSNQPEAASVNATPSLFIEQESVVFEEISVPLDGAEMAAKILADVLAVAFWCLGLTIQSASDVDQTIRVRKMLTFQNFLCLEKGRECR